jgi:cytochrome c-type biogenesis protein CcmH/NrfG
MSDTNPSEDVKITEKESGAASHTPLIVVSVVAAVVSAATVAYFFWRRSQDLTPRVHSVQQLMDRCHDQLRDLHHRLDELTSAA